MCGPGKLDTEWEVWAYGTEQELEKSIDTLLPAGWGEPEVGIN